ncbi:hypothetical protein L6164_015995 [Bauhinia variegata]|uniref:Uncharacterized protein n=1 Tax=Bauhinia variegata TaxID=167791 RepID=A0ACB9NMB2_BAUVA|nr:hypothetical protein L6164_015995 [Bauhinia variegata]
MTTSPSRDLQVFDFKEEEEVVDLASGKHLEKFKTPSSDDQSTFKCEILGHVSQVDKIHVKDVGSIPCVDDDVSSDKINLEKDVSDPPLEASEEHLNNKEKCSELEAVQESNFISHENTPRFKLDVHAYEGSTELETKDTSGAVPSPRMDHADPARSGSPSSNESIDVNSEADEYMNESPSSSPSSGIAENVSMNGYGSNLCMDDSEKDDTNTEIALYPDYVIYQNHYYMGPQLTFSHSCIKINGSTASLKQGTFNLEWAVDDLIDIKSQLFQNNGMVIIKLRVISNVAGDSNNVNGTSGIEELKIVVSDSNWSLRHKLITSLNVKYVAIWIDVLGTDMEDDSDSLGSSSYFPNFDKPFEEIIYPKGDPDAVSLSKRDVDLLQPDTFVNDNIIDFYIKYLKNQIQEEEMHRFHFFNSFFFRKLADMDKNPSSASDGKAAFLRVRKWTRKINLFEKDYIFIPVNFNLHWSLIVICHPGEVVTFNEGDQHKSLKVPCILHMDSIKGTHSGLKNLLQSYLLEEWKERQKDTWEEALSSRFFSMRFLPVAVPQQENSFDCGLFLLHYLELFLAKVPVNFNPFKLTKFSNFLNEDWFPPAEAYLKRTLIQKLISKLLENRSHEGSSSNYSEDNQYSEHNENQIGIEFLAERCAPEINAESTMSHAGQGIEITLLSAASSMDPQSYNNSGLVLRELFEPGATEGALLGQCQSFDHRSSDYRLNGSIFPIEDDTENDEQFMYLTTDANFQQMTRISPQTCELPYLARSCGAEISHKLEISLQAELNKGESSLDTSSPSSDDSDEIGIIENRPIGHEAGSSQDAKDDERNCSSMENLDSITEIAGFVTSDLPIASIVECSQDPDTVHDGNENGVLDSSCEETTIVALHQVSDVVDDKANCDDVQMTDDVATDICEEQAAKRRRLTPSACESDSMGVLPEESHL